MNAYTESPRSLSDPELRRLWIRVREHLMEKGYGLTPKNRRKRQAQIKRFLNRG